MTLPKIHIVYIITNTLNGKIYIGMSGREADKRWRSHLSAARQGSQCRFHHALRKYGPDPWTIEVIHESPDIAKIRLLEEIEILERKSQINGIGYNATPGGCGGWIVPESKTKNWKEKLADRAQGAANANAIDISNETIEELALQFFTEKERLPSHRSLVEFGAKRGLRVPKSFQAYRFGGTYQNLLQKLERITGCKFNRYYRSEESKENLRKNYKGAHWYHNDALQKNKQFQTDDLPEGWVRGRKRYK